MKTAARKLVARFRRHSANEDGFTLLEVIVSLTILSVSLSVLYQVMATALGYEGNAETLNRARLMAQGLLARVGTDIPASVGERSGEDGQGMRWRLSQKPLRVSSTNTQWTIPVLEVSVDVSWGGIRGERSIRLTTLRIEGARPR